MELPKQPKRKINRLLEYDYSKHGAYFITICTIDKVCIFGKIADEDKSTRPQIILSETGQIVKNTIIQFMTKYEGICIDKHVVMPNHIHLIISINGENAPTISIIIKQFKEHITKQIGKSVWQKSFYDHVIRDQKDYDKIWKYIDTNPDKWQYDKYFI